MKTRMLIAILIFIIFVGSASWSSDEGSVAANLSKRLVSLGKIRDKAIDLKVWIDRPASRAFRPGEAIVVHVKSAEKTYLTALYVSSIGDVVVLLPNRNQPKCLIQPNKEHVLFADDGGIRLIVTENTKRAQLVFYASPAPINLEPLKIQAGQAYLAIPHTSTKDLETLAAKIEHTAQNTGFNRIIVRLDEGESQDASLEVAPKMMGLPLPVESSKPEGTSGVRGYQQKIKVK